METANPCCYSRLQDQDHAAVDASMAKMWYARSKSLLHNRTTAEGCLMRIRRLPPEASTPLSYVDCQARPVNPEEAGPTYRPGRCVLATDPGWPRNDAQMSTILRRRTMFATKSAVADDFRQRHICSCPRSFAATDLEKNSLLIASPDERLAWLGLSSATNHTTAATNQAALTLGSVDGCRARS